MISSGEEPFRARIQLSFNVHAQAGFQFDGVPVGPDSDFLHPALDQCLIKLRQVGSLPADKILKLGDAADLLITRDRILSCEFNMDTACVELYFADGTMLSINTIGVENEVADNMLQRSELDYLIYNKPLEYADLVLNGGLEAYVSGPYEHRLTD